MIAQHGSYLLHQTDGHEMRFCGMCMYALYVPCRRSIGPLRRLQRVFHILTPSLRATPLKQNFSIIGSCIRDGRERRRARAQCAPPVPHPLASTVLQHGSRTAMSNDDDGRDVQPVATNLGLWPSSTAFFKTS